MTAKVRSPDGTRATIETAVRCGKSDEWPVPAGLEGGDLRELVRTNDVVLMSAIGALLDAAGIGHLVLDGNMSVMDGSLGVLPRRILVHDEDNSAARDLLAEAGLGHELRDDG
jgi:hypothetical protein